MRQNGTRFHFGATLLFTLAGIPCFAADDFARVEFVGAKKTDAEKIVGVWRFTKAEVEGMDPLPPLMSALARWSFTKDGKLNMSLAKVKQNGGYKVVEAGKLDMADGPFGDMQAILRFDGDEQLTLCFFAGKPGRPTEFTGEKGKGQAMFVFKRAKAGEETPSAAELAKFKDELESFYEQEAHVGTTNKLKNLVIGMHVYHDREKTFPAHAIYSKDGKTPLLSWRVAILPDIDQMELYKEFKLDEAWDSTHNKKLIAKMPDVFKSVGAETDDGRTVFQVFTGPNTVFSGKKGMKIQDITAGTSNTFLIAEGKNAVTWTEPADLSVPKEKDKLPALGGMLKKGFLVAMGDGSVRVMPFATPPAELRAAISPLGKE